MLEHLFLYIGYNFKIITKNLFYKLPFVMYTNTDEIQPEDL